MPNLTAEQLALVEQWASEGANLNTIQDRLKSDFGLTLTYLDARLLMLETGVRLKEKEKPKAPPPEPAPTPAQDPAANEAGDWQPPANAESTSPGASLQVTVDQIALPETMVSGKVTFSDGTLATWFFDQSGRIGLGGVPQGYRPPQGDVPLFQRELDRLLQGRF